MAKTNTTETKEKTDQEELLNEITKNSIAWKSYDGIYITNNHMIQYYGWNYGVYTVSESPSNFKIYNIDDDWQEEAVELKDWECFEICLLPKKFIRNAKSEFNKLNKPNSKKEETKNNDSDYDNSDPDTYVEKKSLLPLSAEDFNAYRWYCSLGKDAWLPKANACIKIWDRFLYGEIKDDFNKLWFNGLLKSDFLENEKNIKLDINKNIINNVIRKYINTQEFITLYRALNISVKDWYIRYVFIWEWSRFWMFKEKTGIKDDMNIFLDLELVQDFISKFTSYSLMLKNKDLYIFKWKKKDSDKDYFLVWETIKPLDGNELDNSEYYYKYDDLIWKITENWKEDFNLESKSLKSFLTLYNKIENFTKGLFTIRTELSFKDRQVNWDISQQVEAKEDDKECKKNISRLNDKIKQLEEQKQELDVIKIEQEECRLELIEFSEKAEHNFSKDVLESLISNKGLEIKEMEDKINAIDKESQEIQSSIKKFEQKYKSTSPVWKSLYFYPVPPTVYWDNASIDYSDKFARIEVALLEDKNNNEKQKSNESWRELSQINWCKLYLQNLPVIFTNINNIIRKDMLWISEQNNNITLELVHNRINNMKLLRFHKIWDDWKEYLHLNTFLVPRTELWV